MHHAAALHHHQHRHHAHGQGGVLPLPMAGQGARVRVVQLRGQSSRQLEEMGLVPGARLTLVCHAAGNFIVEVKGSRLGIDRSVAMRIMVEPV